MDRIIKAVAHDYGISEAIPIIRSMYPSQSREKMVGEFSKAFAAGAEFGISLEKERSQKLDNTCDNKDCECSKPAAYWIELDSNQEPTGNICFAYYKGDTPIKGYWVKVRETGEKVNK